MSAKWLTSKDREALERLSRFCEQVAADGILPSRAWFAETAADLRSVVPNVDWLLDRIVEYVESRGPCDQYYGGYDDGTIDFQEECLQCNRSYGDHLLGVLLARSAGEHKP